MLTGAGGRETTQMRNDRHRGQGDEERPTPGGGRRALGGRREQEGETETRREVGNERGGGTGTEKEFHHMC